MSTIDEQKNCTISLAFSQGANSVLSMERNNAVLFSSHRKRGHVLFCRSMYPPLQIRKKKETVRRRTVLSYPYPRRIDTDILHVRTDPAGFQSTTPVRGSTRRFRHIGISQRRVFQSTTPVRGSTRNAISSQMVRLISIHDPRAGIDLISLYPCPPEPDFNPRPPCGDRLMYLVG